MSYTIRMASARIAEISPGLVPVELDVVGLLEQVETEHGVIPRGTEGTVVVVWEGLGYGVEFDTPFEAVVNLRPDQMMLVHRA